MLNVAFEANLNQMNAITKPTDAVDEEEEIGIIILIQRFLDSPFSPNFFVICYGHPEEEKKKPQRYVYSSTTDVFSPFVFLALTLTPWTYE